MKHSNKLGVLFMLCMSLAVLVQLAPDTGRHTQTELKAPAGPEPQEAFPIAQPFADMPAVQAQAPIGQAVAPDTAETADVGDVDPPPVVEESGGVWDLIRDNLSTIVLAVFGLAEVIVRLTPTEKDNSILNFLKRLVDWLIPNISTTGGKFPQRE